MNSTLESYPLLKHRLNNFSFSFIDDIGSSVAVASLSKLLIISTSPINITTTTPLVTLVQNACELVEKAKKTEDNKGIEEAEKAISLIYDDYCREELEYELRNLKKSLELPEMIVRLEEMFQHKQNKDALLKETSKGLLEATGLLKFYPEIERKAEMKIKLNELEEMLKGIYSYQDIQELTSQLQEELKMLEGNASPVESFLNGLYDFRNHVKSVSSILNQSLLSRQDNKDLKSTMKEIAQGNTVFDEQIVNIINQHIVSSSVSAILRLINETGYSDVIDSSDFGEYFVTANKDKFYNELADWEQAINETVGMYLITHAINIGQLNRGILFFEYVPYIDLGKERIEVCQQFFNQHRDKLKNYKSSDEVMAVIQPIIDERNNKVQRINEASNPSEMLEILKSVFNENGSDLNELNSKYVWLRKEQRVYRSLNQVVKDIEIADEEKIASILKNSNSIEIYGEDEKYRLIAPLKDSRNTLNLLD